MWTQWNNPQPEQIPLRAGRGGVEITMSEVKPCRKYLRAIDEFPIPQGITDVRAWFGLVNQVAYAFSMASVMSPFRALLKPSTPFSWNDDLQHAFDASKSEGTGSFKSTASAHLTRSLAARRAGRSHSWDRDSPTLLSKARLWPWQTL